MPYIGKTTDGFGVRNRFIYLASSGDTSVSGADANGATLTFTDGAYVDVYLNGVLLKPTTDYNTSTANTIAGLSALNTNDEVTVVVYDVFTVADMVSATSGGTFSGNVTFGGNIDVDGTTNLDVVDIDGALTQDGGAVFNEASADVDFRIESNNKANMFCVDAGNDSVIIGHNAKISAVGFLDANLQLVSGDAQPSLDIVCFSDNANHRGQVTFSKSANDTIGTGTAVGTSDIIGDIVWGAHDGTDFGNEVAFIRGQMDSSGVGSNDTAGRLIFGVSAEGNNSGAERARLSKNGEFGFNNTSSPADDDTTGIVLNADGNDGLLSVSRNTNDCAKFNRKGNDGTIIELMQAGTAEGTISVSGSAVTYGGFTGSHWSRLKDNSKPTILRGTVIETIDEMMDWYQVEFTKKHDGMKKYTKDDQEVKDGSKSIGDDKLEDTTVKRSIELPSGKSVGDTMTYTENGVDYVGTIIKEHDIKHVKCKISDTSDCANVYGVFLSWDNDDDTVNDMYVNSLGTSVVRIHKDQTVVKGDLLTSNGDGTAKKQDDDIIRSKTIGKVLTNIKQETYSDGSYTVPCALYCG